jgi:hypothetical protein
LGDESGGRCSMAKRFEHANLVVMTELHSLPGLLQLNECASHR